MTVCLTWVSAEMVSFYFYGHRPGVALGIDRTKKIHFQINLLFLVALCVLSEMGNTDCFETRYLLKVGVPQGSVWALRCSRCCFVLASV